MEEKYKIELLEEVPLKIEIKGAEIFKIETKEADT